MTNIIEIMVNVVTIFYVTAASEGYDTVIFDTAGRQVVDERLMDELKQIKNAVKPDEMLLVVDAMTGQEAATLTARCLSLSLSYICNRITIE